MRRAIVLGALVLLGACSSDLRAKVEAAGVFSPRRVMVGDADTVVLGQMLFSDAELSGNRNIACATCHLPQLHAVDGRRIAMGQDRARLSRAAVELFNRGSVPSMFWDGRLTMHDGVIAGPVAMPSGITMLPEAQVLLPLLDRHEMRGEIGDVATDGRPNELATFGDDASDEVWAAVVARLISFEGYRILFARAYPDVPIESITIVHVARAIAAFEARLWELTDTAFDAFLGSVSTPGRDDALDDEARDGASLFFGDAGCARCHGGPLLSDGAFHDIGVPQIGPGRDAAGRDEGRFALTGAEGDRFAFRTPPLRNVALTAPYMHDGAYPSLDAAVRHHLDPLGRLASYDDGALPDDLRASVHHEADAAIAANVDAASVQPLRPLTEGEIASLVAFLQSLSSQTEMELPFMAGIPSALPSGLPIPTYPELLED